MEQTPVYGATPSSYGVTTLSTSQGGMSGYMPPPPGLSVGTCPLWRTLHPWSQPQFRCTGLLPGDWMTRDPSEQAGFGTTGSSDGTTHPPATSISQGLASNTIPAGSAATG